MELIAAWAAFWVAWGVADWQLSKRGWAFSHALRRLFHTDTKRGRVVLAGVLALGAAELWHHLVDGGW